MSNLDELTSKSDTTYNAMLAGMRARIPVMLIGGPGTSKTATILQLGKDLNYDVITIVPSRMDPQDISGFPTKGEYSYEDIMQPVTEYAPQKWQMEIMKKKCVILFLDEFSNANPSVRASLLSFMQDRQFPNGDYFPEETILVGAMNPTDSAADGYELDKATSNRILFLSWNPLTQDWLDGMSDNWGRGSKTEKESEWRDLIVRFITDEPGALHNESPQDMASAEAYGASNNSSDQSVARYAWPSRRSWDNLAKTLGAITATKGDQTNLEDTIMVGLIGFSAAGRFREWIRKNGALNINKIISNPDSFKRWNKLSLDDTNLILRSACENINESNVYNIIRIFEIIAENDKHSYAAPYIKEFVRMAAQSVSDPEKKQALRARILEVVKTYKNVTVDPRKRVS